MFTRVSREELQQASDTVEALARPPDDNYYLELVNSYRRVRLFLPTLLRTVTFSGTQAGQPVLSALQFLAEIEGQRKPQMNIAPLEAVPPSWQRQVVSRNGEIDRRAYTLCGLEQLLDGLRRRDVFVDKSDRWGDPQAKLFIIHP